MALVNCGECGKSVSSKAGKCPSCGGPILSTLDSVGSGLKTVFTLCIAGIIGYAIFKHDGVIGGSEPAEPSKPIEYINVSALQLAQAYEANEVRADEKYKNKDLIVKGRVQSIDKSITEKIIIVLEGLNTFQSVHAEFKNKNTRSVGDLEKGDVVALRCKGNGLIIGSPRLDECDFADLSKEEKKPVAKQKKVSKSLAVKDSEPVDTPSYKELEDKVSDFYAAFHYGSKKEACAHGRSILAFVSQHKDLAKLEGMWQRNTGEACKLAGA